LGFVDVVEVFEEVFELMFWDVCVGVVYGELDVLVYLL